MLQKLLSYTRRAVDHYHMIEDGDRVAVGVSGGKDSLTLLTALAGLRRFYPNKFEVVAITLEMGYEDMDFTPVQELCDCLSVPYIRIPTQIKQIVFDVRQEENPCSLCAKLRRGALHEAALAAGCKKVALGHHFDDVVETYMLSLMYEGRISCFKPVTYLDRADITPFVRLSMHLSTISVPLQRGKSSLSCTILVRQMAIPSAKRSKIC
ncbi:MAG: ATP-binding protein [Butyricicoccus sp.]